jgi:Na+-driven multidrug efflux pump
MLAVNAMLNLLLVSSFCALGAALATLLAYVLTIVCFYRLFPIYRDLARLQKQALYYIWQVVLTRRLPD